MGDEITQPAHSADVSHAKHLQEALRGGSPPALIQPADNARRVWTPAWDEDDPTIQRAYLQQLVECAPDAITILDAAHHITRINSEFTRLFGFTADEAVGR